MHNIQNYTCECPKQDDCEQRKDMKEKEMSSSSGKWNKFCSRPGHLQPLPDRCPSPHLNASPAQLIEWKKIRCGPFTICSFPNPLGIAAAWTPCLDPDSSFWLSLTKLVSYGSNKNVDCLASLPCSPFHQSAHTCKLRWCVSAFPPPGESSAPGKQSALRLCFRRQPSFSSTNEV
jgi:hypothetical protein